MSFQPKTLDIDEGIFEKNLRIVDSGDSDQLESLFPGAKSFQSTKLRNQPLLPSPDLPSVSATPQPGICVKTKNIEGKKVFVNVCKIQEIPPAPPITEDELRKVIEEEDYSSEFRVPMSLGAPRPEKDKSGQPCLCCDVAVNTMWFDNEMDKSPLLSAFVIQVAMEGLCEKYGDEVNLDRQNWTVLKNKKYMGDLQKHVIQQRAKGSRIQEIEDQKRGKITEEVQAKKPLIQETSTSTKAKIPVEKTVKDQPVQRSQLSKPIEGKEKEPNFVLLKNPTDSDDPKELRAKIEIPGVRSSKEITLDVGEDRIIMEARKAGYILDIFVPFVVNQDACKSFFLKDKQELNVLMPVLK